MAMNGVEKWASANGAEKRVKGGKIGEEGDENVDLKLMTSSNSTPRSNNEAGSAHAAYSHTSHFSSPSHVQTNSLSHVPPSACSNVIPAVVSKTGHSLFKEEPVVSQETTSNAKSPDMGIRKKRFNVPSAITTAASVTENVNQTPTRHRKNGAFASRNAGSANASPAATTPSTPVGSGAGSRFKFPTVKMGGFLFRKKCSWPTLNYTSTGAANAGSGGSGTSGDRSPSPTSHEQQKRQKNKGAKTVDVDEPLHRQSPKFYNNVGSAVAGGNANETSPLLKRINNRLQLDRSKRYSTATNYHCREHCYCMTTENHCDCYHRHGPAKRCASKEDPGPRTEANTMAAMNDVMAALMVEEMGDSSCAGSSGACNKSASYPTAFGAGGRFGTDVGANSWNSGAKYKLVKEGQIQVCRLNHPRTVLGKLTSSKLLRRWETHTLILDADEITSKTVSFLLFFF